MSNFEIKAELTGVNEYLSGIRDLRSAGIKRVLRGGMRKVASVMNKSAKALETRIRTGQLKRSLGVKVRVYPSGVALGIVEPRAGFRIPFSGGHRNFVSLRFINPRKYAHLVERGTKERHTKSGASRGAMPPAPFLEPAFTVNEGKVEPIFAEALEKELVKMAGK